MKNLLLVVISIFLIVSLSLADENVLKMATTTSTDNTGLLDYLKPIFEKDTGIEWQWVATGTGKALELGKNCDVDILLVHEPNLEKKFVENGYGVYRKEIMYNDFILVGPIADPAHIKGGKIIDAFKKIYNSRVNFVSRGDESGTHMKEKSIWKLAGINGYNKKINIWYKEVGQGMITTLDMAAEMKAYTLTDRGTYIKFQSNYHGKSPLVIMVEGDPILFNQYSVIPVSKKHCPKVKSELAERYVKWITSPRIQKIIGDFKLMGQALFFPNAN
jgi:tungstate transport system substrate-binding protein